MRSDFCSRIHTLDIMLTNKPKSFYKSYSFVTGLHDCHKLIVFLELCFKNLHPNLYLQILKNFHASNSLCDLNSRLIQGQLYQKCEDWYNKISQIFSEDLNYHMPLTQKSVWGNHASFTTKTLSKAIMNKSKSKNS